MSDRRSAAGKVGLALAGGVIEGGLYEVGVLCALEDAIEGFECTRLDAYVGVSAGAVVAAMLANRVAPRTLSRAILSQADPLLNLDPDLLFTPAVAEYASRVRRIPGTLARWLRGRIERPLDMSIAGSLLELGALAPVGLFDSRPMERYLAAAFAGYGRTNDFRQLAVPLRIVAVKLDTSEVVAFGDEPTAHVPISQAVQASVALPGFYCPVEIEGEHYIDGVARRTVNASLALDEGVDLLFCVNPIVPVDLRRGEGDGAQNGPGDGRSLVELGLPGVLSQTFRTMIHSRMRTGMRSYQHDYPGADVVVIEPDLSDHRMFFSNIFSFSNRRDVCEHAYASTRRNLLARADELEEKLTRHGMRLRREVLRDGSRTLFGGRRAPVLPATTATGEMRDALQRLDQALERLDGRAA